MSPIEHIIRLYAPFSCVSCGDEADALLCSGCAEQLSRVPSRCYKCKATTKGSATCVSCRAKSPLEHVYVATHYDELAKKVLSRAKYGRARAGLQQLAVRMAQTLPSFAGEIVIVPVPTATRRVRLRGYDQAVVLAKSIAHQQGARVVRLLARLGQAHQVGATRKERLQHLEGAFRVRGSVSDAHVVLVDDVLTTGATLETAARVLKKAGVKHIDAMVFAHAN